jgi:hypothetical protein
LRSTMAECSLACCCLDWLGPTQPCRRARIMRE